jgi:hypothetical protein
MHRSQSEAHVVDIEIAVTGIFPVYDPDSTTFIIVSSPVNNKEITARKNEFINCP